MNRITASFFRRAWAPAGLAALLMACAGIDTPSAHAASPSAWPPVWQDQPDVADAGPPTFSPPSAANCRRAPSTREVPGRVAPQDNEVGREEHRSSRRDRAAEASAPLLARKSEAARPTSVGAGVASADAVMPSFAPTAPPAPAPTRQAAPRPAHEPVTAGVVDDNADFGEYLAYRQRKAGLPVHHRDVSERYLLEVLDAAGQPVHDAEVAVQRAGVAAPVMWARTDTSGRVWLQPRVFLSPQGLDERSLGVAVRKGGHIGRATLTRGQRQAVQVRLGSKQLATRPRLDLVFLVDATGSMGDEIAKLKRSMAAMAQQLAQLPGQPDICWGLVAYRDRGDAFITRTHDFTDDLGAFQQVLARVQAGGGGDTPEALNEALSETVHGLSWRSDAARLVVLVADAPPHLDYTGCTATGEPQQTAQPVPCPQYDREMQAALAKGIKVFAVGASGLDAVGEYIHRQIAQYTAGRFVFLTYREASDPASGPGTQTVHDVKQYSVQTLDRLVVRLVSEELAKLPRG